MPIRLSRPRTVCLQFELLEARIVPSLFGNQLFPDDNPWNQKISAAPVAANSSKLVSTVGLTRRLHPDFGAMLWEGALIGIPYNVVSGSQPKVNVIIDAWPEESDLLSVPIPDNAILEGDPQPSAQNNSDRHLLVYDKDNNVVYELFNARRPTETLDGQWHADAEAVWDLNENSFRPAEYTSADAAGLPILPGLVRADEVFDEGIIKHALRFTVSRTDDSFVYPASHQAGVNRSSYPPMGTRFRLKQSFDISGFSTTNQIILQALKDYGMIVADNGANWFITGEPSPRWNDDDLHHLSTVLGKNFEVVDLTPRVSALSQLSGPMDGGTLVAISGLNFAGGAGKTQVFFGSAPAAQVHVVSDTAISVIAPPGAYGAFVNVTVHSPYGTSLTLKSARFFYGPKLQFAAPIYTTNEDGGFVLVTVTRTDGSAGAVKVRYKTISGSAGSRDYVRFSGTLLFADGETSKTILAPILNDARLEAGESFRIVLGDVTGAAVVGPGASTLLTITDDEYINGTTLVANTLVEVDIDAAMRDAANWDWVSRLLRGKLKRFVVTWV